jgi:hypothetical protein
MPYSSNNAFKQCHTLQTMPHSSNNATLFKQFHTLQTMPHSSNNAFKPCQRHRAIAQHHTHNVRALALWLDVKGQSVVITMDASCHCAASHSQCARVTLL